MTEGRVAPLEYKFMENPWAERPAGGLTNQTKRSFISGFFLFFFFPATLVIILTRVAINFILSSVGLHFIPRYRKAK